MARSSRVRKQKREPWKYERPLKVGSCFRAAGQGTLVPKKSYATRDDAEEVALLYGFRSYPCPDCGQWHLTST